MKPKHKKSSILIKYAIAVGIAAVLASSYALSSAFPYKYEMGSNWNYPDLITEADLPVMLVGAQSDSIIQQVEHRFAPVFKMDKAVLLKHKEQLVIDFKKQVQLAGKDNSFPDVNKSSNLYLQFADRLLSKIYEQGILPEHEKLQGRTEVQILRGEELKSYPVSKVFTLKTAGICLSDSLSASKLREPEFLLSLLEHKIEVNLSYDEASSEKARTYEFQSYLQKKDTIKQGSVIAEKGVFITEDIFRKINSYRKYVEGNRSGSTLLTRFAFSFLLNLLFLSLLFLEISYFQPRLFLINSFWLYLALLILIIQGAHIFSLKFESSFLLSPILLFPILLKKNVNPMIGVGTLLLMVMMASQSVLFPYVYLLSFSAAGLFFIFSEQFFAGLKYGNYFKITTTAILLVLVYAIALRHQNQMIMLSNLAWTFTGQSIMMLIGVKYSKYVK
ncbi:MAG: hypothetical protein ACOYOA_14715 [Saprospiraceae bacterium]